MIVDVRIEGSRGTVGGLNAVVRCHLHPWDLSDHIFPEYMAEQLVVDDDEEDCLTMYVLRILLDGREFKEMQRIMAAMVRLWHYLDERTELFKCAEDSDPTSVAVENYDNIRSTILGKVLCDRLVVLHNVLPQSSHWKGCARKTDAVVRALGQFCSSEL